MVSDNPPPTARAGLVNRQIPEMRLSDGGPSSNTAPPPPRPLFADPAEAALHRFQVQGNAIITGGTGDLGLHAARALLEHGLSGLMLWDTTAEDADSAIDALAASFPDRAVLADVVDVSDEKTVEWATARAVERLPGARVDHLLCFAGVVGSVPSLEAGLGEFNRVVRVNLEGGFLCAREVGRQMARQSPPGGSITLIGSISAHRVNYPQPQLAYNVSKAGVVHMAHCLAAELAVHGIRANSISPGYFDTLLTEGEGLARARAQWCARNPFGRLGDPTEIEGVVVLLCSRAGSYINGADFVVDGGGSVF